MASRPVNTFYYNTLLFEDQTEQFRILAASVIEGEDVKADLEDVLLKTPSEAKANDVFVADGRIN